ncbi:hypothetical protein BV22DRAFT_1007961 [Leucogyrophana mollusca]|uniref:Uncharacterized protein n=1 Tax=Leucogyrophana mollusca TaxID=85980 RepID=A0ACB8BQX1_9AGAM|nr:hypothetical protein BV22DRAFT_1007961 [Leucogyrophana mollusca]
MPFFQGASGVNASNSIFNDVARDQTNTDSHNNTINIASHNSEQTTNSGSNNDSSVQQTVGKLRRFLREATYFHE